MSERRNPAHPTTPGRSYPPQISGTKRAVSQTTPSRYGGFQSSGSAAPVASTSTAHPTTSGRSYLPQISGMKRAVGQTTPSRHGGLQSSGSAAPGASTSTSKKYYTASASGFAPRKRVSFPFTQPLAPPPGQRPRLIAKQAGQASHASISVPIPVKTSQQDLPYWQVNDMARARAADSSGRRFAAMSVGNRAAAAPGDYRNITERKYAYANQDVRDGRGFREKPLGRKAARKIEEQTPLSDDEEEEESSDSNDSENEDDWESIPDTDKETEKAGSEPESDSSDDSIEIIDMRLFKPPVIELLDDTPPMSPRVQTPRPSTPTDEITIALENLVLSAQCMQTLQRLPFLRRNLRRGFLNYCHARGVPTDSDAEAPSIAVLFRLDGSDLPPHEASLSCYECPICQLHLPFQTKEMLELHLDQDHAEIRTSWAEGDDKMNWRLELLVPSKNEDVDWQDELVEVLPHHVQMSPTPEPVIPPPPNPFGPTARFPFLPAKSEYGGPDVTYSARFGGPKIYDLLGTLPMESYGVLAWYVLDREEEIFESDDIPDEHKIMHALWARWIFHKRQVLFQQYATSCDVYSRNVLVANFFNGIKSFLDEYWRMIRLAAGWDALRYWLLMLMANKFLSGREVAELIRRYERWCTDSDD
ncbi:hypothetical protein C8R44DRAFT_812947 [Mycena epipterygia]|nr:hypothetical protein C8R44DRAFT_812947 [Mycena epipterygia]